MKIQREAFSIHESMAVCIYQFSYNSPLGNFYTLVGRKSDQVPNFCSIVAMPVAKLLVLHKGIKRFPSVCPLPGTVVSVDNRPFSCRRCTRHSAEGWPICSTLPVANLLSGWIFIKCI